jgi:hypothetical protein
MDDMVSVPNKFYRGVVYPNPKNPHPKFRFIIVDTVKEVQDDNGNWYTDSFDNQEELLLFNKDLGDILYNVYASYYIDNVRSGIKITETTSLTQAINIAQEIMANHIVDQTDE